MARIQYSSGSWLKVLLLAVLIMVLIIGGLVWFDYLGLINVKDQLAPLTRLFGIRSRSVTADPDDIYLLDKERLIKQQEAVDMRYDEITAQAGDIEMRDSELKQRADQLTEQETALKEKENSLNQALNRYENEEENLRQSARYLMGMEPEKAVNQLVAMDEYDAVNLLRTSERLAQESGEASLVAYWLSLMDPQKSASIQEKLIRAAGGETFSEEQWFNN
jgi:flagellar protein FlbB